MSTIKQHERHTVYNRTIRTLIGSQLLAGAGIASGIAVGALLVEDMTGSTGISGLAAALFTLGAAISSKLIGNISQKSGRRIGLSAGYFVGGIGALGIVIAAIINNLPLLFISLVLYGSGTAANLQARYAGADLATPSKRGRAISIVLVASTLGAVLGPNLISIMGRFAGNLGVRELAGPFMLSGTVFLLAASVVFVFMRPDPLLTARRLEAKRAIATNTPPPDAVSIANSYRAIRLAALSLVITQLVMVAVMTMTPVHMTQQGHSLAAAGLVISIHIAGMFLPSLFTGALVDRYGYQRILAMGGVTLLLAGLLAAISPSDSVAFLAAALGLLGLGWNLGLIAGTAAVSQHTLLEDRARIQGSVDLSVSLAGAAGGLGSGFIVIGSSYQTLAIVGGILGLLIIPIALRQKSIVAHNR